MSNSIRELTEKIYNEGVVKANQEAQQIIAQARAEAEKINASANKEYNHLIKQAEHDAEEIRKKAFSEINLAGQKMISNLKQQVTNLLTSMQVDLLADEVFNNEKFVRQMLLIVVESWAGQNGDQGLSLLIPEKEEAKFISFFQQRMAAKLNQGVELKVDPSMRNGFKIGPKDGHYLISFTAQDFENYFKSYLKERTWKLICGNF